MADPSKGTQGSDPADTDPVSEPAASASYCADDAAARADNDAHNVVASEPSVNKQIDPRVTTSAEVADRSAPTTPSDADTLPGNVKVTRQDWLNVAMDLLVSDGVGHVKVLTIGQRLGVSRSSFYWYFKSRKDLLSQLLDEWERTNTGIMVRHTEMPSKTITDAVNTFFRCVVARDGFNHQLDFAVREWARRDGAVRRVIDRSDTARHQALARMFERHGYAPDEADIRARVLYYQQIGYYALDLGETLEERLSRVAGYLYCFTGVKPSAEEIESFATYAREASA